jgi:hypothetical protein
MRGAELDIEIDTVKAVALAESHYVCIEIGSLPGRIEKLQICSAAVAPPESSKYPDPAAVRLSDNAFQFIFRDLAVQPAVFIGITESDVDMGELSEIELVEVFVMPVGEIPDYPVLRIFVSR